ncbi:transcription-repair coupling factor [Emticicia oligotrophica DSM 17448]|uniref:Transcription-repair-coupling factor n=1 Tax=Emticicia oligotrophica (strain DSM 17448 / CIP 109782 / MTCC 6937 / GPTSA100-15) TaxID=929562 RepID=A0ABM5N0X9_EMTOG|nr:transcription-repair coupling factor [Emticicia oligotrophica]AFK03077.1 transcription-repair coupling factor [Emticicia oligotrophica DSM 17448]
MKAFELLKIYQEDSFIKTLLDEIKSKKNVYIKGLSGSLDSVIASVNYQVNPQHNIFILNDKEDAAYFYNDLQNLLDEENVFLFPMSYKKPYLYEEIDNANVLQRAEVLNQLNNDKANLLIVTYPEALSEKVINKKSLIANTLQIKIGDKLDIEFISELLISYDFEKADFVYEPGQFSVRGGIVDIFSYASEFPCRIELFGDEIDSLRLFNPESQLSQQSVNQINIIPDVQNKLIEETRESFFNFIRNQSTIWIKDVEYSLECIEDCFNNVEQQFQKIIEQSGGIKVILKPEELFETRRTYLNEIKKFSIIEFGTKSYFKETEKIIYPSKTQPSFNKDFKKLIDNVKENQSINITTLIASDSLKQLNRLESIFEEIDPFVKFQALEISLRGGFIDELTKIACYTDHQIFDRYHRFKVRDKFSKSKALTLKELRALQTGDFVTHIDYGIGRFVGLEKVMVGDKEQEAVRLIYRDNDILLVNIHSLHKIAKYSGKEGSPPTMSKLGSGEWENKKSKVKRQVKDIAKELISLYAKRRLAPGFQFSKDGFMQAELESSFLYEDTPDQAKATADVKDDMEKPHPMDRLVCGDVGFGKTEIAIRAAFKSVADSKQVAVLVPTTVLAMQHTRTFKERLSKFPVNIEEISRFKSAKEISQTLKNVKEGKTDILVGTHRILNKDIEFKNLGLLIIDEEQKFGVKAKDRLKEIKHNVDVLTLTATPIPRTLHFSLLGARDLSIISTPPPNRQPVTTEVHVFKEEFIRDAISYELKRGGQVFFVHNRVNDIESIANIILRLVPDAKIGIAHGQMDGDKLEKVMMKFIEGDYDILVSTNIIESGLDISNANTIIINQAQNFGMSDLHQMRGRVGRSNRKAFCYLLTPPISVLSKDSRKRLQTLEEFSDLGDGFKVSMRDLDIRGAGNLLGAEQSGFINDLGYETYHKILDEAVQELKENEFKDLFMKELGTPLDLKLPDCLIETDLQIIIPETYVGNISERLSLYNQLDNIEKEDELQEFHKSMIDRFGPMPEEVENLFKIARIRWKAEQIGFEKLTLKNNIAKGYFVSQERTEYFQTDKFGRILDYIKNNPKQCSLKEIKSKLILTVEKVQSIDELDNLLRGMVI